MPEIFLALTALSGLDWIEILKYASIPVVAGIVGWGTNWAAIELTFKPVEFRGIRPFFGWQGIIPSKAERMASIFVDSTMVKLGTLSELQESLLQVSEQQRRLETAVNSLGAYDTTRGRSGGWLYRNAQRALATALAVHRRVTSGRPFTRAELATPRSRAARIDGSIEALAAAHTELTRDLDFGLYRNSYGRLFDPDL